MFFALISKLQSSKYSSGDFQLNVGCFSTRPHVLVTTGVSLVLTGISVSLTAIIVALATSITVCIMVCVLLCSKAFFLALNATAFCEPALFLSSSLLYVILSLHHI